MGLVLAGLAQAASIASPWDGQPQPWLQWLSIAALIGWLDGLRVQGAGAWRAAFHGWLFATAWLAGTFWWLFISMHTYGGLPAPLAVLAVFALAAALALYYALAAAVFVRCSPDHPWRGALFFVALWTLAELLRGGWFTGFPWGAGGYAHVSGPLAAYAPWLGVYGTGAISTWLAALLILVLRRDRRVWSRPAAPSLITAAVLLLLPLAGTAWLTRDGAQGSAGTLQVALLQGNIAQDEKFIPGSGVATALQWYGEQLQAASASLVVTPETAVPLLPRQLPRGYLDAIAQRYGSGTQAALVGLPYEEAGGLYSNTLLAFGPDWPQPYRYDKHHLVPFGEFIPSGFQWFIDLMQIPLGDFQRGGLDQARLQWQGQRIAPNICYEDLFGDEIAANFRDAALAPTMLLNVSNIAWFGNTVAIDQHLAISRMRALEFQRPMLRATNTGATVVIDHHGRVTHALPRHTRGVLQAEVEGRTGITPYAAWASRFGLLPLWGVLLLCVIWLARRRRRLR